MATYTAVLAGGNWNVAATWGGAGFPIAGDTAILTTTSGPVTVTGVDAVCLALNMSGYSNTLTIANGRTLTVFGTGASIIFGGTIATGTTGVISTRFNSITSAAISINFNGVTVPRLTLGYIFGAGGQTVTISGPTPTVENLNVANGSAGAVVLAGTALNISSSLVVGPSSGGTAPGAISGVAFNFIGTACSVNCTGGLGLSRINNGFTVASTCTLTLLSTLQIGGGTITFSSGSSLVSGTFGLYLNALSSAVILDTSNVTWYSINHASTASVSISSDINVLTNFTNTTIASCSFIGTAGTPKNINIQGSFSINNGNIILNISNTIVNLNGTGVFDSGTLSYIQGVTTININTSGYTIGSAARNWLGTESNVTINLVGTSVATVNAGHTLLTRTTGTLTLNTNNTGSGGNEIIWRNFSFGSNTALSLTNDTTFSGNLTGPGAGTGFINGAKLLLGGNLTTGATSTLITGTSTIELYGNNSVNWNTAGHTSGYQNNITINKVGGIVNLLGTINYGLAATVRTLDKINGNIVVGTSTVIIPTNASVVINNMLFNNLTLAGGNTMTQNTLNTISNILSCSGSAIFAGTAGFTTSGFSCTLANSTLTFQNINANPGAIYTVNGALTITGTQLSRVILQAAGRANFTGGITGNILTVSAGTNPSVGMTVSQASGISPNGLLPFITNRPVITAVGPGAGQYTLNQTLTTPVPAGTALAAGYKAKFILSNIGTASQNVFYAQTQDIDSNGGITILSAGSNGDDTATNTALFRTLNWGPLIAPSGSVYYTFVS